MKKFLSVCLAAVMLISSVLMLSACGKKGTKLEINKDDVDSVYISPEPDFVKKGAVLDIEKFVDAYNSAEVGKVFDETDGIPGTTLILFMLKDKTVIQAFYQGESEFIVSSSKIDAPYRITSEELEALLYHKNLETPEFVTLDASVITNVIITPERPEYAAAPDTKALVEAYNKGELTKAYDQYTEDIDVALTLVLVADDGTVNVNYLGEDEFTVTGALVKIPYRMTCPELTKEIYAVKEPTLKAVTDVENATLHIVKDGKDYDGEIDTAAVCEAYNKASVGEALSENDTASAENLIVIIADGAAVTLHVTGENEFTVDALGENPPYKLTSAELYKIFTNLK